MTLMLCATETAHPLTKGQKLTSTVCLFMQKVLLMQQNAIPAADMSWVNPAVGSGLTFAHTMLS